MAPKKKKAAATGLSERLELRLSAKEKRLFQEAATRQGITLSHWLRLAAWRIVNEHEGRVKLIDID
jgi:uncharacterized protein (DUF1778 family)